MADVETIASIWHLAWRDGHLGHVPDALLPHRGLDRFLERVPARIERTTVAAAGSRLLGFVTLHADELEQIFVLAEARGSGVAAALLEHGERQIAERFDVAWLAVVAGNARACRFYERNGWRDAGPIDYEAEIAGGTIVVPTRRYEKQVRGQGGPSMTITITAFERSPDGGKGLARDTRVRWALEEVGQPYEVRLVSFRAMKEPAHVALHPFGQIPTYEEGDLALFETGAIVFHIAAHHAGLLPDDANARARAIMWMFAALNSVEPAILELVTARLLEGDKPWTKERLPLVEERLRGRLKQLSARLGHADWLDGAFSAGDLMMVSVLLRLRQSGILDEFPNLSTYVARGEARPAYQRAFAAQLAINTAKPTS